MKRPVPGADASISRMTHAQKTTARWITWGLMAPATLWLFVFLVLPFIAILVFAFGERAPEGGYQAAFTFAQFLNLPSRLAAFQNTLVLAPVGAALCLVVAYPVAYYLAVLADPRHRLLLVSIVVIPFWTSLLVRTYAWMYLLGSRGIPHVLEMIGISDVRLINTPAAVLLGIVYGYLPLMIMPIYVSLDKLDRRLLEASADLGAKPAVTFLKVTVPLSLPGVMTGLSLVTVLLLGEYLIPQLLGGGKIYFIGNALVDLFLQSRNWPLGSAIAVTLVAVVVVIMALAMKIAWRTAGTRQVDLL
jgi:spermidine/putrescine transport system permease protein